MSHNDRNITRLYNESVRPITQKQLKEGWGTAAALGGIPGLVGYGAYKLGKKLFGGYKEPAPTTYQELIAKPGQAQKNVSQTNTQPSQNAAPNSTAMQMPQQEDVELEKREIPTPSGFLTKITYQRTMPDGTTIKYTRGFSSNVYQKEEPYPRSKPIPPSAIVK